MTNEQSKPLELMSAAEIAEQRKRVRTLGSALTFSVFGLQPVEDLVHEPEYPREMRGRRRRLQLKVIEGGRVDPDRAEAERFLALLDPDVTGFTFQTFDDVKDRKDKSITRIMHGSLGQCWKRLCTLNAKGAGVYVTVNQTNLKGRASTDVERVRCVFQEDDHGYSGEYPLAPSLVAESSPGKAHRYWLTDWPADDQWRADFASCMRRMVESYGSDASAKDISRVLRLPGFLHQKGAPHLVRIVEAPGRRYSREQIVAAFPPVADAARKANGEGDDPFSTFADALREPPSLEKLAAALNAIPNNPDTSRDDWVKIGLALHCATGGSEDGFSLFDQWSQLWEGYDADNTWDFWDTAKPRGDITAGTLFKMAYEANPNWRDGITEAPNAEATKPRKSRLVLVRGTDVVMRPMDWIWPGHLLRGGQELLTGVPAIGKSQVQCCYVACSTACIPWPDGSAPLTAPVNVIMVTAEDTLDQTSVPRLVAAGADLSMVRFIKGIRRDNKDRQFMLGEDLYELELAIREIGNVGLVCIDPITAFMGGKMDSHKTTEVRSQLGPLKDLAERTNVAFSTITHPAKNAGPRAIDHFIGSQAFIAAGRIGHVCVEEVEADEMTGKKTPTGRVLFTNPKNVDRKMPTLAYRVVGDNEVGMFDDMVITAAKVVWDEQPVEVTADEAVAASAGGIGGVLKNDEQTRAARFLTEMLKEGKPVSQKRIAEAGDQEGFSLWQLKRAKAKLGVISDKTRFEGEWMWSLPLAKSSS
jgi:hypothetical protein